MTNTTKPRMTSPCAVSGKVHAECVWNRWTKGVIRWRLRRSAGLPVGTPSAWQDWSVCGVEGPIMAAEGFVVNGEMLCPMEHASGWEASWCHAECVWNRWTKGVIRWRLRRSAGLPVGTPSAWQDWSVCVESKVRSSDDFFAVTIFSLSRFFYNFCNFIESLSMFQKKMYMLEFSMSETGKYGPVM